MNSSERLFDFDDFNSFAVTQFLPYFTEYEIYPELYDNDEDMDDDIGEQLDENRWFCWHGCEGLISLHEQVCG